MININEHGLIVRENSTLENSKKSSIQNFKQAVIEHEDAEVAILWKNVFHWKRFAEIGDGMTLLKCSEESIDEKLNRIACMIGIGIFDQFNEEVGKNYNYLYKFPKDEESLERINDFFESHGIENRAVVEGNYIRLEKTVLTNETIGIDSGVSSIVSFLFGLFLVYGDFRIEGDAIHNFTIELPMIGSIAQHEALLVTLQRVLWGYGIHSDSRIDNTKDHQIWRCESDDGQLLQLFTQWMGYDQEDIDIAPIVSDKYFTKECRIWLKEQGATEVFLSSFEKKQIKRLKK